MDLYISHDSLRKNRAFCNTSMNLGELIELDALIKIPLRAIFKLGYSVPVISPVHAITLVKIVTPE